MSVPAGKRLAAADVLRVASIFIVGWFHIWQQSWLDPGFRIGQYYVNLQQVVRHGYMMVDELLVLSGFLLALPAARRHIRGQLPEPAGTFYRRRLWRIVPAYYLTLALVLTLWALPRGLYPSGWAAVKDMLAHMTFLHTFSYETYLLSPMFGGLWTLAVEVQFYFLWPALSRAFLRRPGAVCGALAAAALLFRGWVFTLDDCSMAFNQLPAQLDLYACGMAAAMVFARLEARQAPGPRLRRWLAPAGMLLTFAGMVWIMYLQPVPSDGYEPIRHGQMLYRLPLGLLGGIFLTCGCLAPAGLARALGNRLTRFLADISFNFYMWHQFLALRFKDWNIPAHVSDTPNFAFEQPWQSRYTLVCFLGAALFSAALTYLWEKPLQNWGLKKGRQNAAVH